MEAQKLPAHRQAIFIFVDGHLPSTGAALMSQMYKDYKVLPHPARLLVWGYMSGGTNRVLRC